MIKSLIFSISEAFQRCSSFMGISNNLRRFQWVSEVAGSKCALFTRMISGTFKEFSRGFRDVPGVFQRTSWAFQGDLGTFQEFSRGFSGITGDFSGGPEVLKVLRNVSLQSFVEIENTR